TCLPRKTSPPTIAASNSSLTTTPTRRIRTSTPRPNPTHPGLYQRARLPDEDADSRYRHQQRPSAGIARGRCWCQVGWSVLEQLGEEPAHPGVDVVTDQTHALQALDPTLGRLVSHPPLARTAGTVEIGRAARRERACHAVGWDDTQRQRRQKMCL